MPPLPSLGGARGRRLMRVYATALGYAAGHCHITAVGDWYARQVAGWTGIITGALVLLILFWMHAQAEAETEEATRESATQEGLDDALTFLRALRGGPASRQDELR